MKSAAWQAGSAAFSINDAPCTVLVIAIQHPFHKHRKLRQEVTLHTNLKSVVFTLVMGGGV